jgi:hypothetical protein
MSRKVFFLSLKEEKLPIKLFAFEAFILLITEFLSNKYSELNSEFYANKMIINAMV